MSELESILDKDDKVIQVVHRHWFSLVFPLLSAILVGLIGVAGFYIAARFPENVEALGPLSMFLVAAATLILLGLVLILANLKIYRQNGLILTDSTLYYSVQIGLLRQNVSRFNYGQLEAVSFEQRGILSTLFDYGNLIVKTAADHDDMNFTWAPHPKALAEAILESQTHYHAAVMAQAAKVPPLA